MDIKGWFGLLEGVEIVRYRPSIYFERLIFYTTLTDNSYSTPCYKDVHHLDQNQAGWQSRLR